MSQVKISNLKLKNKLILAPMVDVTDLPYRLLCRKAGASLCYTEMIYNSAIIHENPKTKIMMKTCNEDKPLGIQITGNSLEEYKSTLLYLKPYQLIDLNCGCPSSRLINNEAGSFLLKNPKKIADIIKVLKTTNKAVTAKIRLGFKSNQALKIAKSIEKAGADAITIHARLASQTYSIPAQWSELKKIKKQIGIPLIGNGDISSPEKAQEMLDICDAAMFARASIGNPLIFKQTLQYLKTGKYKPITIKQNLNQLKSYLRLSKKYKTADMKKIKLLSINFLKGFPGAKKHRQELVMLKTFDEIKDFVKKLC